MRVTGVNFWNTKPRLVTEPILVGVAIEGVVEEELARWREEVGVDLLLLRKELHGLKPRALLEEFRLLVMGAVEEEYIVIT